MFVNRQESCPVCSEETFSKVVECGEDFDSGNIKDIWANSPHDFFFPFYKCSNCSTYYTHEYVSEPEIPKLYSLLKDNLFGVDKDTYFKIQHSYALMIKKYLGIGNRGKEIDYFEIGPDHGTLQKIITAEVSEVRNLVLVEPNQSCWPSLEKLKPKQLLSDFKNLQLPAQSLDLAVAVHVLDHMLFPNEFLQKLAIKMRTNGCIFIVVHNGESWLRHLMGRKWPPFCIHHPQIFNDLSLARILKSNGFKNVKVIRTMNKFPLGFLISNALCLLGLKISWSWGPKISLPLGNIAVLGQKR